MANDPSAPFMGFVNAASEKYGVSSDLLKNMLQTESNWNPSAVSPRGAAGIAQFMPATAKEYGVDVNDPESSIHGMAKYMSVLQKKYNGDPVKAVAAYNWGMGNVDRQGMNNAPSETRSYVKKILGVDMGNVVSHNLPTYFSAKQQQVNADAQAEAVAQEEKDRVETSGSELYDSAVRENHIVPNLMAKYRDLTATVDPTYVPRNLTQEIEYLQSVGVSPEYAPRLREAVSQEHYFTILTNIQQETEATKLLNEAGMRGFGYRMLSSLTDPVGAAVGAATGGAGFLAKHGRGIYTAGQAAIGGATAASFETLLYNLQETKDSSDIWAGLLGGMVLQGGLGQLGYKSQRDVSRAIFAGARASALRDVAHEARVRGQTDVAAAVEQRIAAEDAELPTASGFGDDSVGAARVEGTMALPEERVVQQLDDIIEGEVEAPTSAYGFQKVRQDIAGYLGNSSNPVMRSLSRLVEDGVGLKKDANGNIIAAPVSAEEHAIRLSHTTESAWLREMNAAFAEFDQGGFLGREGRYQEFQNQVRHVYELGGQGAPVHPAIQKAANATKSFFDTFKKEVQEAGLPIHMVDGNYLTHIPETRAWHELNDKYGLDSVVGLLKESLWNRAVKEGQDFRDPSHFDSLLIEHDAMKDARGKKLVELQKAYAKVMSAEAKVRQAWKARGSAENQSVNDLGAEKFIESAENFTPEGALLNDEIKTILADLDGTIKDLEAEVASIQKEITNSRIDYHKGRTREARKEASDIRGGIEERLKETQRILKEHQSYRKTIELDLKAGQREVELFVKNRDAEATKEAKAQKKEDVAAAKEDVKAIEDELRRAKEDAKRLKDEYAQTTEAYHDTYKRLRKEKDTLDNWETNLRDIHANIARAYATNILRHGDTRHLIGFSGMDMQDATTMRLLLQDAAVPESRIDDIIHTLGVKVAGPDTGRAKNRIEWDMGSKFKVNRGGEEIELSMTDLFVKDLGALTQMYSRQMSGHIAAAKVLGLKSKAQFGQALQKARDMQPGSVEGNSRFMKELRYAENAYDRLVGLHRDVDPKSPFAALAPWAHRLRGFNFVTKMAQVGFAQIAEIARVLQTTGLKAAWKQMPALREVFKLGKDGKLTNTLLRELEAMTGIGTQRLRNSVFTGIDGDSMVDVGGKIDKVLHKGTNIISDISGFNALTTMQQRMAMAGFAQRFVDLARKVQGDITKLKPNQIREFASYGLDEGKLAGVLSHLNDSSKVTFGRGSRLHALNVETWDVEAASHFTMAMQRMARRVVQEGSIGASLPLMSTMAGKILLQFRNFAITAFTKQLMNGVAQKDMRVFLGFISTAVFGGLSYMLQTAANYGGTDQFEEKMSFERVAQASLARTGYSSILPMTIDSIVEMGSAGAVPGPFSFGARSTNMAAGIITGSASFDTLAGIQKVAGLPFTALSDDADLTKKDFDQLVRLIPGANLVGIKRALMPLAEDLPKNSGQRRIKTFFEAFE